jgi:hypothetical protein
VPTEVCDDRVPFCFFGCYSNNKTITFWALSCVHQLPFIFFVIKSSLCLSPMSIFVPNFMFNKYKNLLDTNRRTRHIYSQWRTLEGSRIATATPEKLGGWVVLLAPKYLHHNKSNTYSGVLKRFLRSHGLCIFRGGWFG